MENENGFTRRNFLKATASAVALGPAERTIAASAILRGASHEADSRADLARQFQEPPRQARPWAYWVWLGSNTTRDALTRDLEAMKAKGIVGCILYGNQTGPWFWKDKVDLVGKDYRAVPTDDYKGSFTCQVPTGLLTTWSPPWRKLVCFAAQECTRLGISLVVSNGMANTSGPIPIEYGEQKLVWVGTSARGSVIYDGILSEPSFHPPKGDFPRPGPQSYRREVAVLAFPDRAGFSRDKVINLTEKMDAKGHLRWEVPEGGWKIFRFAQVPTGTHNIWGYFCDSMSTEALEKTWAVTMAPLLKEMTPTQRRALVGIEDDSWEAGETTWTKLFPEEFKKRRGYDLVPYLPVIAGIEMADPATRARIFRDYRLTISDLVADNHYGHLKKLANDNGLICYAEAAGPDYDEDDKLKTSSRVDVAMAEFWMPSAHRPGMSDRFLLRNAANANHIYGKRVTMCESFTSIGPEWEQTPFNMKPVADQAFCDGLNRVCFHAFSQSPSLTAKPGYVYLAGTHYDPGVTWWDESPAFTTYLARCSAMLQAGRFVADVIFYHGDNIGIGEPRKTIPPTLGEGYNHDNCNSEVLLSRMSVRGEHIVLADGMIYRVLALPVNRPMPFADLKKVAALIEAGATVVGPPPTGMGGMPLHTGDTRKFDAMRTQLWGGIDGSRVTQKRLGAGCLIWGQSVRQVLLEEGVLPDFEVSGVSDEGTFDWIHREADGAEIYYVTSRWTPPEKVVCTFRVSRRQPELWDPVTGEMRDAPAFRQKDGRTVVPLEFGPCGSIFVVFRRPIPANRSGETAANYPTIRPLTELSGPWTVHFDPKWGGPATTVFDHLIDWTGSPEPGIQYYSGRAVYHKKFDLPTALPPGRRLLLDLGEVHDVASVRLNGRDLGVLWTKPARADITAVLKRRDNNLELTVVNLWPNRLIRDAGLPKEQRLTETNIHKFVATSPLLPSGLFGPVSLLAAEPPRP